MNDKAEQARLKHKYRRMIMTQRTSLPIRAAARLIGPDCAFHLYRNVPSAEAPSETPEDKAK